MNTEPIAEKDLARRLNISRNILRDLRHELLIEGDDFTIAPGNGAILLNESGVAKLQERLSGGKAADGGAQQSLEQAAQLPAAQMEIHTFYVSGTHPRVVNTRIVLATADPELKKKPGVTIRVRDNRVYALRTAIYATASIEGGPVYNVFGRAPRWKGQKLPKPPELLKQEQQEQTSPQEQSTPAV